MRVSKLSTRGMVDKSFGGLLKLKNAIYGIS